MAIYSFSLVIFQAERLKKSQEPFYLEFQLSEPSFSLFGTFSKLEELLKISSRR